MTFIEEPVDNKAPDINVVLKSVIKELETALAACTEASGMVMPSRLHLGLGALVGGILLAHLVKIENSINDSFEFLRTIEGTDVTLDDLITYARKTVKNDPGMAHLSMFITLMETLKKNEQAKK